MALFLTARDTGERVQLPVMPDGIAVSDAADTVRYTILRKGQARLPRGSEPTAYGWKGLLPGAHAQKWAQLSQWREPALIEKDLRAFLARGAVLTLMVTELNLVEDVFIESFEADHSGGAGDIRYAIRLAKYRKIEMRTVPPQSLPPNADSGAQADASGGKKYGTVRLNNKNSHLNVRKGAGTGYAVIGKLKHGAKAELLKKSGSWYQIPYNSGKGWVHGSYIKVVSQPSTQAASAGAAAKTTTYTVKSGDSLYKIAKARLGNGNRYAEIYRLNQSAIDSRNKNKNVDRYTVYPGQALKLPS